MSKIWDHLEHIGSYTGTTNDGVKEAVARGRELEKENTRLNKELAQVKIERDDFKRRMDLEFIVVEIILKEVDRAISEMDDDNGLKAYKILRVLREKV